MSCKLCDFQAYWALGLNWDGNGYHVAVQWLAAPVGGGVSQQTCRIVTAPAPSACVVMKSYLALEGCAAGILGVFL